MRAIQVQITETQGNHVEGTGAYSNPNSCRHRGLISFLVLRPLNVPIIKTIFGGMRECIITIGQATKEKVKKTKKQAKKTKVTSWTVDAAGHAQLKDHCVNEQGVNERFLKHTDGKS